MAGDLRYTIAIDNSSALRSIEQVKSAIAGFAGAIGGALAFREVAMLASSFQDLRTSLQILYKDAQLGSDAFDDIKKFAATSIFSVEDLTATVIKLKAAGLEPTVKLLQLFANTSSVAADSVGALQAITDLYARTTAGGLGLEDLNRLADRGIPVFTILSERLGLSRLQISEMGKTAEGARIILRALEDGLDDAFGKAGGARANNVSQAFSNLGDSIGNAADAAGQAGLNEALVTIARILQKVVESLTPLFTLFAKFINLVAQVGNFILILAEKFKPLTQAIITFYAVLGGAALIGFIRGLFIAAAATKSLTIATAALNAVMAKGPLKLFALAMAAGVAGAGLLEAALKKLGIMAQDPAIEDGFKVFKDGEIGAGTEDLKAKLEGLKEQLKKFKVEMNTVVESFGRYNKNTRDALALDTELLGVSREMAAQRRNEADINKRLADQIADLRDQKAKLTAEEKKEGRGEIIDNTIKKLEAQAKADIAAGNAAITSSEKGTRSNDLRLFGINQQIASSNELKSIQDRISTTGLSEIEKLYYDIDAAAKASAKSQIDAATLANNGIELPQAEQDAYYAKALENTDKLKKEQRELYKLSRQFETGWGNAFRLYVSEATNAAMKAQKIFQTLSQSLEDALYSFFTTGKFGWKQFADDIIKEMIRIETKQLAMNILTGGTGKVGKSGGGLLGLGGLFGFLANGGPANANKPYIVGERGPELFVPNSTGTVVPNGGFGGGGGQVTYNINAVDAMSFKQMIAADPTFLHAVAEQGRRRLPGAR
jgi:archaellum component FlaC